MVLPLFKVLSIFIRVFSRPLINYTKQVHIKNDATSSHPLLRKGFIYLGNRYHWMESWVNRKFMKIQTQFAFKQLNDELAIEKGIQFFYEIVFYTIVISLPLYDMWRSSLESKAKSLALQQKIKKVDERLNQLLKRQQQQKANQKQLKIPLKSQQNTLQQKQQPTSKSNQQKIRLIFPKQSHKNYKIYYVSKSQQQLSKANLQTQKSAKTQAQAVNQNQNKRQEENKRANNIA